MQLWAKVIGFSPCCSFFISVIFGFECYIWGPFYRALFLFFFKILFQQPLFSHTEPALHVLWKSNIPRYLLWECALPVFASYGQQYLHDLDKHEVWKLNVTLQVLFKVDNFKLMSLQLNEYIMFPFFLGYVDELGPFLGKKK